MKPGTQRSPTTSYDHAGETARARSAEVVIEGRRLNRTTARIAVRGPVEDESSAALRQEWAASIFPTTQASDAPVLHLGWPTHGPFVASPRGTYFDAYLAVAQKLLDEHHPRFLSMLADLSAEGAMLRREILTDDFLCPDPGRRVKTPADLAALWTSAMQARWSQAAGWKCFFSSSGAEAVEAAIKLCYQVAYKRFLERFGAQTLAQVQAELDHRAEPYFDGDPGLRDHRVYESYPFFLVGCEGAFHGRTLGALSLTWSKRAQRLGYPKPVTVHHIPFNAPNDVLRERVDWRPLAEILKTPGELARVVREQRRIPRDLLAGVVAEPFQGEGGYLPGDPTFFARLRAVCDETGAMLVLDEVQSVGRTGRLFMGEHLKVRPDLVCTAKSMVIGVTLAPGDLARYLHTGWHSNTWGSGRVLDTNFAFATLDTFLHHKDPAFGGLSYAENVEVKGAYLAQGFDRLAQKHPHLFHGHRGVGLMRAFLVKRRADVIREGWARGLKLLGCGWEAEVSAIRVLFLADTLTREIDEFLRVLDEVLTALK